MKVLFAASFCGEFVIIGCSWAVVAVVVMGRSWRSEAWPGASYFDVVVLTSVVVSRFSAFVCVCALLFTPLSDFLYGLTHVVFRCASAAVRCMVSTIPTSKKKTARQDVPAGIVSHDGFFSI